MISLPLSCSCLEVCAVNLCVEPLGSEVDGRDTRVEGTFINKDVPRDHNVSRQSVRKAVIMDERDWSKGDSQ